MGWRRLRAHDRRRLQAGLRLQQDESGDSREVTALQREVDQGICVPMSNWTLGEYLEHWLAEVEKPNCAPKTHKRYELVVRRHILPRLGRKKLSGVVRRCRDPC